MKSKTFQWLAIFLIFETGFLHYLTAQNDYLKAPYLGYVAMLIFLGAFIAAFGIYHAQTWGWVVGALTAAFSLSIFLWSITFGLPGQAIQPWAYPYGLVEAAVAGLFIVASLLQAWKRFVAPTGQTTLTPVWFQALMPAVVALSMAGVSFSTYQWDTYARMIGYHTHVGSLRAVCNTPVTSFDELEEKYGIRVVQMNISMLDSLVDVRLFITDPKKAQSLLQDQGALLVDQQVLILAPHQHTHWLLKKDKAHIMFFPTANNTVHSGSEVSLVFGRVRVEPLTIK
jgi:hypothetical protein